MVSIGATTPAMSSGHEAPLLLPGRKGSRRACRFSSVAKSQTGKWVAKVASTGGGRTYRKQRPTNYYAAIAVIVVLGLASVFLARHDYRSGSSSATPAASTEAPIVNSTSYASLAFDICGTLAAPLAAQPTTATGPLLAQEGGVVRVAPTKASQAGENSNIAAFAKGYSGLTVTSSKLTLPVSNSAPRTTVANGDACPAGTPNAGKKGEIVITRWSNFVTSKSTSTTDPAKAKLSSNVLVTVAFVPKGSKVLKPDKATITKMQAAAQQPPTTSTTTPVAPSIPVTTTTGVTTTTSEK